MPNGEVAVFGVAPAIGVVDPAIGVVGVDGGETTTDGARPVENAGPPAGSTPLFRLTSPWLFPATTFCACGNSSERAMPR